MKKILCLALAIFAMQCFAQEAPENMPPPPPPCQKACKAKCCEGMKKCKMPKPCPKMKKEMQEMKALVEKAKAGDAEAKAKLQAKCSVMMDSHIQSFEKVIAERAKQLDECKAKLAECKANKDKKVAEMVEHIISGKPPCDSERSMCGGKEGPMCRAMGPCPCKCNMEKQGKCCKSQKECPMAGKCSKAKEGKCCKMKDGKCPMAGKCPKAAKEAKCCGKEGKCCKAKGGEMPPPPPPTADDDDDDDND